MREAGVLLSISSLPSPYGIGTLGREAYSFVDFLASAGQSIWQMLPNGPTGFGDSPYQSFSSWAGNPYFIDFDLLVRWGLLMPEEIDGEWGKNPSEVDYGLLFEKRFAVLEKATARQNKTLPEYTAFCKRNAYWLNDYALFMAIKEAHGNKSFTLWPEPLRKREKKAMKLALAQWGARAEFWRCLQYFFYKQWAMLKAYAKSRGIAFMGDIPIYVSPDSSELWANPKLFQTNADGMPTAVAGVPPDAFSSTGQLWGNPLYNWPVHRRTGYAWWLSRLRHTQNMYNIIRIDHFRGFASYFSIPATAKTAENGKWEKGPSTHFIRAVKQALPKMKIVAEDLGLLDKPVYDLLEYSKYPGMKVLQFAFDYSGESTYLPHMHTKHAVVYTGTHDNPTTVAWAKTLPEKDLAFASEYLMPNTTQDLPKQMLRAAMASVCNTAIVPLQDWLCLDETARMNTPSTLGGRNWCWRLLPRQANSSLANKLYKQAKLYGRLSSVAKQEAAKTVVSALKSKVNTPKRILTISQMKKAEDAANLAGISYEMLMENAGQAVAKEITNIYKGEKSALFLCGRGNNAGDAFVASRALAKQGWRCEVRLLCGHEFSPLAKLNFKRLQNSNTAHLPQKNQEPLALNEPIITDDTCTTFTAPLIIDGVFGTGFKGHLPENVAKQFKLANAQNCIRIALDLPSGLNGDSGDVSENTFISECTFTFGAYKPALTLPKCQQYYGKVKCLNIGLF